MTNSEMVELLMSSTEAMFAKGVPLMNHVLPKDGAAEIWEHYPDGDIVNGEAGSRFFYHSHPPGERIDGEHGHFHLFFAKESMPSEANPLIPAPDLEQDEEPRVDVVHIAALSISLEGLPMQWFTTNRWVTDEWVYPADDIMAQIERFDLRGQQGDPLINQWLTAMVGLSRGKIGQLLAERDVQLRAKDMTGEDNAVEIMSAAPINFEELFGSE